jgi:hypothetical protein
MASRTHANRWNVRIAAKTGVASVHCAPRAFTQPRALQAARKGLIEVACGKGGLHGGRGRRGYWGEGLHT